jgi:hypothetical protein
VIAMLRSENCKSLRARYGEPGEELNARAEEYWPEMAHPIFHERTLAFSREPTPVEVLKAIHHYTYQSCEHPEWWTSEARAFVEALKNDQIHKLPGYNDAPWGWDEELYRARRGGAVSLSAYLVQRGL